VALRVRRDDSLQRGPHRGDQDGDFRTKHLISGVPRKLVHVTTGNITNDALLDTFRVHPAEIEAAFRESGHVELTEDAVISHPRRDT
jgi:predicted nuclease of predicted toxin-antitoxin system